MQLHIRANVANANAGPLSIRCPSCKQIGTFQPFGTDLSFRETEPKTGAPVSPQITVGHWICPNPPCKAHVFVVIRADRLQVSYPPERIDFDSTNIPTSIVESLEEAITCHADQCFTAAAIMVRKTLE